MTTADWIRANLPRLRVARETLFVVYQSVDDLDAPLWVPCREAYYAADDAERLATKTARSLGILDSAGNVKPVPDGEVKR